VAAALEMTRWFDTNYHYIVPEFEEGMRLQIDEPCLVTDLSDEARALYPLVYRTLAMAAPALSISLATYFGDLGTNRGLVFAAARAVRPWRGARHG